MSDDEAALVAAHFDGDAALYRSARALIVTQLREDLRAGDAALAAGDRAALRRVAHDLKSALTLIGQADAAQLAARLEAQCLDPALAALAPAWAQLRGAAAGID